MEQESRLKQLYNKINSECENKERIDNYIKEFPKTPQIIVKDIARLVIEQDSNNNINIGQLIIASGRYIREKVVDDSWEGSSSGGCWDFSIKLRDTYNFIFEQLSLESRAFLIHGTFTGDSHFWVAVMEKANQNVKIHDIDKSGIFIDGTVDQYQHYRGYPDELRNYLKNSPLLILQPADQTIVKDQNSSYNLRSQYLTDDVSEASPEWFVRG